MTEDITLDLQGTQIMLMADLQGQDMAVMQRAKDDLTALYRTSNEIASILDVKELYVKTLEIILTEIPGIDCCSIHVLNKDSGELEMAANMARKADRDMEYKFSRQILDFVIKEKTGILTTNPQMDDRFEASMSIVSMQIRGAMCVPLSSRDRLFGVIQTSNISPRNVLNKDDLKLLTGIGSMVGSAIENAMLYSQVQEEKRLLEEVNEKLQIAQESLIRSEKMSAVGQLTAGIVHDVKNPLHVVLGYSELMKSAVADSDVKEVDGVDLLDCIGEIEKGAVHCNEIVSQLLQFSRQSPPEKQVVQINDVVKELEEFLAYELRPFKVLTGYKDQLPAIKVDVNQIKQTLMNIILNALQAMENNQTLKIETGSKEDDDGSKWVYVRIEDSGCGMSEEVMRKIFDPFFTTKEASKDKPGGTGLGLSTCYGIIKNHGGTIEVESSIGVGTAFTILLPEGEVAMTDSQNFSRIIG